MKPESIFINDFKQSIEYLYPHCFFMKIPDMPIHGVENLPDYMKFNPSKRFDCLCVINGIPIAIEFKVIKDDKIKLDLLRPGKVFTRKDGTQYQKAGQLEDLLKFNNAGGLALIIIKLFGNESKMCCILTVDTFLTIKNMCKDFNEIKFQASVEGLVMKTKVGTKTVWDVRNVFEQLNNKLQPIIKQEKLDDNWI